MSKLSVSSVFQRRAGSKLHMVGGFPKGRREVTNLEFPNPKKRGRQLDNFEIYFVEGGRNEMEHSNWSLVNVL